MHARTYRRLARTGAAALATGAVLVAGLVAPADALTGKGHAYGHLKSHCRALHATGVGTDNGDGTTSATLYQGDRTVGTSEGVLAGEIVDGMLAFTGTIVLTTSKGSLEAAVEGTFDTVTGDFAARSVDISGKGAMKNAAGRLRLAGTQDLVTGEFTEVVHAKVCTPKQKQH
jgi:hypothetical protein